MFTCKRLIGSSVFVFVLAGTVLTQEIRTTRLAPGEAVAPQPAGPLVTATATAERVRFVAPGTVIQVRLEVYNEAGQKVFDTELRGGNVLDWLLQDGAGQRLTAGSYASVLTVKSLSGRLSQRVGLVKVYEKTAALEASGVTPLTGGQKQSIGPMESEAGFRVLGESEAAALTAVMHDGTTGQLNRTAGALSFRLGDFFSGADTEQMRLTEEGNLGIGTEAPEFKLDVAGAVRARQGFVFGNGSSLNVNEKGALQLTNAGGELIPDASGAGTQGRLARWIDGAGTLGDSVVNDTGTALQLTAAPNVGFDTNLMYLKSTSGTTGVLAGSLPSYSANNGPFFAMRGNTYTTIPNQRGIFTISAGNVPSPGPLEGVVKFNTGNDQIRMLITAAGNVGVGTTTPTNKLDVVGVINTSTQYNIGGNRVLAVAGSENVFVGLNAGVANTGLDNSFFGGSAGAANLGGSNNSFFGRKAGEKNTTGSDNSFFGQSAGVNNTMGGSNAFFGEDAGFANLTGGSNAFFGLFAGLSNSSGSNNTFIGSQSGPNNASGNKNVAIGFQANFGGSGLTNATAIGAHAIVDQSNSLVLGSVAGVNGATSSVKVGVGTTTPQATLDVNGTALFQGGATVTGTNGDGAVLTARRPTGDPYVIIDATTVAQNSVLAFRKNNFNRWLLYADSSTESGGNAGSDFKLDAYNNGGGIANYLFVTRATGNVGIGTNTPSEKLSVGGQLRLDQIDSGLGAGTVQLCRNAANVIATCTSSSLRYKQGITPFRGGLDLVRALRPISFTWKMDGSRDLGLGAEDVAKVEPLLVTHNDKGEIEGVRYDRLDVVLINAIKQQQDQIETLRTANVALNARLRLIERTLRNKRGSTRQRP